MIWVVLYIVMGTIAGRVFNRATRGNWTLNRNSNGGLREVCTWLTFFLWPLALPMGVFMGLHWFMMTRPQQALPFKKTEPTNKELGAA